MNPIEAVQHQLDAYNDRDLTRFLEAYSEHVQVFRLPDTEPALSGKPALREFYATERFHLPALKAELVNRMAFGNKVIDHERVWGVHEDPMEVAAVYEVKDGLICTVWFLAGG